MIESPRDPPRNSDAIWQMPKEPSHSHSLYLAVAAWTNGDLIRPLRAALKHRALESLIRPLKGFKKPLGLIRPLTALEGHETWY